MSDRGAIGGQGFKEENNCFAAAEDQIKEEYNAGVCWACLAQDNLKDMNASYYYKGKPEVYSELISYCFSIQVGEENDSSDKMYLVCENCISRLRDAANFRTQIEVTRNTFKSLLDEKPVIADDFLDGSPEPAEEWLEEDKPLINMTVVKAEPEKMKREDHKTKLMQKNQSGKKRTSRKNRAREELPYKLDKTDLQCKICAETFAVHKGLQMHMPVHFPNHICEQCGRWFATRTQLACHTASHTTAVEACPICPGRLFKATGSLKAHMRRHAGQVDLYKCSSCPERFPSYNARRRHLVAAHGDENRKYACKHCAKRFCLQSHLSVHVRSVHLQERAHACAHCRAAFFSRRGLRFHMLRHSGERAHQCPACGKRYGRKYTLTEHMKIHTGERAHVCGLCGKAFTQRCTLKGHMAVHDKEAVHAKCETAA